jgi:type I restriction enzyme S subunit
MIAPATVKAFAVSFGSFHRWSVNSFFRIHWNWPPSTIKPLSRALERKIINVDCKDSRSGLVSLHFDGEMEARDADATAFKGKLFLAEAGDVLYSKIDVRNGAIGVVPPSMPRIAVSSEYPVYRKSPH